MFQRNTSQTCVKTNWQRLRRFVTIKNALRQSAGNHQKFRLKPVVKQFKTANEWFSTFFMQLPNLTEQLPGISKLLAAPSENFQSGI